MIKTRKRRSVKLNAPNLFGLNYQLRSITMPNFTLDIWYNEDSNDPERFYFIYLRNALKDARSNVVAHWCITNVMNDRVIAQMVQPEETPGGMHNSDEIAIDRAYRINPHNVKGY